MGDVPGGDGFAVGFTVDFGGSLTAVVVGEGSPLRIVLADGY